MCSQRMNNSKNKKYSKRREFRHEKTNGDESLFYATRIATRIGNDNNLRILFVSMLNVYFSFGSLGD